MFFIWLIFFLYCFLAAKCNKSKYVKYWKEINRLLCDSVESDEGKIFDPDYDHVFFKKNSTEIEQRWFIISSQNAITIPEIIKI